MSHPEYAIDGRRILQQFYLVEGPGFDIGKIAKIAKMSVAVQAIQLAFEPVHCLQNLGQRVAQPGTGSGGYFGGLRIGRMLLQLCTSIQSGRALAAQSFALRRGQAPPLTVEMLQNSSTFTE